MKCADCKRPIGRGKVRRVLQGDKFKRVCIKCSQNYAHKEANPPADNKIPPVEAITVKKVEAIMKLNFIDLGGRLFLEPSEIDRIRSYACRHWPQVTLPVSIVEPSYPDREPEAFRGKCELRIVKCE